LRLATNQEIDNCDVDIITKNIKVKNSKLIELYNLNMYETIFFDERMTNEEIGNNIIQMNDIHDMISSYYQLILKKDNTRTKLIREKFPNNTDKEIETLDLFLSKSLLEVLLKGLEIKSEKNVVRFSNDMMNKCSNYLRRFYWYNEIVEKYEDISGID